MYKLKKTIWKLRLQKLALFSLTPVIAAAWLAGVCCIFKFFPIVINFLAVKTLGMYNHDLPGMFNSFVFGLTGSIIVAGTLFEIFSLIAIGIGVAKAVNGCIMAEDKIKARAKKLLARRLAE